MTVVWQPTYRALQATHRSASPADAHIGRPIVDRLFRVGLVYDRHFPPEPPVTSPDWPEWSDRPSTRVESPAHVDWLTVMDRAIRDLDQVAAQADGDPLDPGTGTVEVRRERVLTRLTDALEDASAAHRPLVEAALTYTWPAEPRFFVDEYYEHGVHFSNKKAPESYTVGQLEDELDDALAAAVAYMSIA